MSRIENGATFRDVVRAAIAMIGVYCRTSYRRPPKSVTLDIDNAICPTYGNQEGARWSTHHYAHGYAPFYVVDVAACAPVAAVLFPAKTPSGAELLPLAEALVRNIRRHWPETQIILRGDSHFARWELMDLCEGLEGVDYIFACAKNSALQGKEQVGEADRRAERICGPELGDTGRTHCEFLYGAGSWKTERRVVARVLASRREFMRRTDVCMEINRRFVVTSLETGTPEEIYEETYCMRAQAENLIKLHKSQLRSDRWPCAGAEANQLRLVVCSAAYMAMWAVRAAAGLKSEFKTVRERLIKIGARFRSTKSRIRVALSSSCPDQELFREVLARLRDKKFIDPATPRRPTRSAERTNPGARGRRGGIQRPGRPCANGGCNTNFLVFFGPSQRRKQRFPKISRQSRNRRAGNVPLIHQKTENLGLVNIPG